MKPVIVGYYTEALFSKDAADKLRTSAENLGYKTDIIKLNTLGSARKDLLYKSSFCYQMLDKYRCPLFYLDVDSIIKGELSFSPHDDLIFEDMSDSLLFYSTSAIYMQPSLESLELMETWANISFREVENKIPKDKILFDGFDSGYFTAAVYFYTKQKKLRISQLNEPFLDIPRTAYKIADTDLLVKTETDSIEFRVTAIGRDSVFRRCLESICENMEGVDFSKCDLKLFFDTAYGSSLNDSLAFAISRFRKVSIVKNDFKNYSLNLRACWSDICDSLVFYFEDDYELLRKCDFSALLNPFLIDKSKQQVCIKNSESRHGVLSVCPSVITGAFGNAFASFLSADENPNKTLQSSQSLAGIFDNSVSVHPIGHWGRYLREIGTTWMFEQGYRRNDNLNFRWWEKS